jgi:hypothetical protein
VAVIHHLPVPVPARNSDAFGAIVDLSRAATADPRNAEVRAELQGRVAHAYALEDDDLIHILSTFPLVPEEERHAARRAFLRGGDRL